MKNQKIPWVPPVVGGLLGGVYVMLDEGFLDQVSGEVSPFLLILHEFLDAVFPILLGIVLGIALNLIRRQERQNRALAMRREKLEREFLLSMLIAQMLHEIQNPLHNILAALDGHEKSLPPEMLSIVQRNLERLGALKKTYGGWDWATQFDTGEPLKLGAWLDAFVPEKLGSRIGEVNYVQEVGAAKLAVHPVVLEQILTTIMENALEAVAKTGRKETVRISVSESDDARVTLKISSTGATFPETMLKNQGWRPAQSAYGLGLGLLLLNKTLEQVDGRMTLSNEDGASVVTLTLPGSVR